MMEFKKTLLVTLVQIILLSGLLSAGTYSSGTGTAADPYQISTAADWQELTTTTGDWDKYFLLTSNLDLDGISITPVGNSTTKFTGSFDGAGYTISNVDINEPTGSYVGLFGYVENSGGLKNISLDNFNIKGKFWTAGLVGRTSNTNYDNISFNGSVTSEAYAGAIASSSTNTEVNMCYSSGSITASRYAGGLLGYVINATVHDSYSKSSIYVVESATSTEEQIGGLIGVTNDSSTSPSSIDNCYYAGKINLIAEANDVGGLIGLYLNTEATVTDSFWDTQISGQVTSAGDAEGKTTSQMKQRETFTDAGWDFINNWENGKYQTYPYLRTRPASDINGSGFVNFQDLAILTEQWLTGNH